MGIICSSDCTVDFRPSKLSCSKGARSEQQGDDQSVSGFEDGAPSDAATEGKHPRVTSCRAQWSTVAAASGDSSITAPNDLSPGVLDALEGSFEENEDDDDIPDPIPRKLLWRSQHKGTDIANALTDLHTSTEETTAPTCASPGDN